MEKMRPLSEQQKQFVAVFEQTLDIRKAAEVVYKGRDHETEVLKSPSVRSEISRILDERNLSESHLAKRLKDVIDTPKKEENLLRAIEMGFRLHGSFAPTKININAGMDIYGDIEIKQIKSEIVELLEDSEAPQIG